MFSFVKIGSLVFNNIIQQILSLNDCAERSHLNLPNISQPKTQMCRSFCHHFVLPCLSYSSHLYLGKIFLGSHSILRHSLGSSHPGMNNEFSTPPLLELNIIWVGKRKNPNQQQVRISFFNFMIQPDSSTIGISQIWLQF